MMDVVCTADSSPLSTELVPREAPVDRSEHQVPYQGPEMIKFLHTDVQAADLCMCSGVAAHELPSRDLQGLSGPVSIQASLAMPSDPFAQEESDQRSGGGSFDSSGTMVPPQDMEAAVGKDSSPLRMGHGLTPAPGRGGGPKKPAEAIRMAGALLRSGGAASAIYERHDVASKVPTCCIVVGRLLPCLDRPLRRALDAVFGISDPNIWVSFVLVSV